MVVNASNREKIVDWLNRQKIGTGISVVDSTARTAMIAVQGPMAIGVTKPVISTATPLTNIRYYHYTTGTFKGADLLISRTGYTGEDGVELICAAEHAPDLWRDLLQAAKKVGGMAAGLGARDTLRLEAAMPLYGHELSETINPIQASLNFAVNLHDREFIGREAIVRFAADKTQPVRVGLQVEGKRVPRQGCPVWHDKEIVGEVTSGTFSPTLERSIAMAYIKPSAQAVGTHLTIDIRGTQYAAAVVPLPFYERRKKH
jgi:aminomethyltransferase